MAVLCYDHCQTEDKEFNAEYVRVYADENSAKPILHTHISSIIPLPDNVKTVRVNGENYPVCDWRRAILREWEDQ